MTLIVAVGLPYHRPTGEIMLLRRRSIRVQIEQETLLLTAIPLQPHLSINKSIFADLMQVLRKARPQNDLSQPDSSQLNNKEQS